MRKIIELSDQAGSVVRKNLQIEGGPLRISFCGGPGDVVGTYKHWRVGEADPRVPSITYSSQLYELSSRLGASLQMVSLFAAPDQIEHDIRFDQVQRRKWSGRFDYFKSQRDYVKDVIEKVDAFDPHIVIVGTDFPQSGWKKISQGRKLILTAHNTFWPMSLEPSGLRGKLKLWLLGQRSKYLSGAVCTSHECVRQIRRVSNGRIEGLAEHPQIFNTFKVQDRTVARKLLYLGRIEESKGIFMLLASFEKLKRKFPDIDLTFAGSGSAVDQLDRAIARTETSDVRFLGRLNSKDVHEAIACTDLLVCPTTTGFSEGLALVGFEAAAHGIPSILSSVVPAQDLLAECSVIFQADNTKDLTSTLEEILSEREKYTLLAKNTRNVRSKLYDPSLSWGSQLAKVLQSI